MNKGRRLVKATLCAGIAAVTLTAVAAALGAISPTGTTLRIKSDQIRLADNMKALTAPAGKVTIVMANPSFSPHNVALRAGTTARGKIIAKGAVVTPGGTSRVTALLKKGRYRFYCSFEGHEGRGMWGILIVK